MESGVKADGATPGGGAPKISNATILGETVWLLSHSKLHRDWPIGSVQQWIFPALARGQFRVYRRNGRPKGFVSWAWMSKEVEESYALNTSSLRPDDWKSGERGWIIDFVAPFGDTRDIIRDLRNNIFPNDVGRYLRVRRGSDTMRIHYIHGARAVSKARDREQNPTVVLRKAG